MGNFQKIIAVDVENSCFGISVLWLIDRLIPWNPELIIAIQSLHENNRDEENFVPNGSIGSLQEIRNNIFTTQNAEGAIESMKKNTKHLLFILKPSIGLHCVGIYPEETGFTIFYPSTQKEKHYDCFDRFAKTHELNLPNTTFQLAIYN